MNLDDNIKLSIGKDRTMTLSVDLSEYNTDVQTMKVSAITIYNTRSYLDNIPVMEITEDSVVWTQDIEDASKFELTLSEQNLNQYDAINNGDSCHNTDMLNDIIIVQLTFDYNASFVQNHPCCDTTSTAEIAGYYPCPIYSRAINSIGNSFDKCSCEESLPYGFVNELLKKKAIDACISAGHYNRACWYYSKFYKIDNCNCSCNGGQKSGSNTFSSKSTKSNCGCHG